MQRDAVMCVHLGAAQLPQLMSPRRQPCPKHLQDREIIPCRTIRYVRPALDTSND